MSTAKKKKRAPLTEAQKKEREAAKIAAFHKLATPRVKRAKKAIELVGNLSSSGYSSTTEQVEKIRKILTDAVDSTMARFETKTKTDDDIVI